MLIKKIYDRNSKMDEIGNYMGVESSAEGRAYGKRRNSVRVLNLELVKVDFAVNLSTCHCLFV